MWVSCRGIACTRSARIRFDETVANASDVILALAGLDGVDKVPEMALCVAEGAPLCVAHPVHDLGDRLPGLRRQPHGVHSSRRRVLAITQPANGGYHRPPARRRVGNAHQEEMKGNYIR